MTKHRYQPSRLPALLLAQVRAFHKIKTRRSRREGVQKFDPLRFPQGRFAAQAEAGAPDTLASRWLEYCAVGGAHQVAIIGAKKLIVDPIQGDAGMRATIDIGEVRTLIIDDQRFEIALAAAQRKFFALAVPIRLTRRLIFDLLSTALFPSRYS